MPLLIQLGVFFVLTAFAVFIGAWAYRTFKGLHPLSGNDQCKMAGKP
jgi:hypothetical protein